MVERQTNSPLQLWAMILNSVRHKGLISNVPNCPATVEESGEMASSFHRVLLSSAVWLCGNQGQMNGSQVPNFKREEAGLRL
jgi:hypothetical protein